jgi:hypothetical protein
MKIIVTAIACAAGFFVVIQGIEHNSHLLGYIGGSILYIIGSFAGYTIAKGEPT